VRTCILAFRTSADYVWRDITLSAIRTAAFEAEPGVSQSLE
jgi:hypothetical protein